MRHAMKEKVALVTGASSGIGEMTALALSEAGARVAVGARRGDRLADLAKRAPGEVLALDLDVIQGVRVVLIEPGFVATELASHITDPTMRAAARDLRNSIHPRYGPRTSRTPCSTRSANPSTWPSTKSCSAPPTRSPKTSFPPPDRVIAKLIQNSCFSAPVHTDVIWKGAENVE
jgi:NAD(P)-dependent dehydrogenase (short-subunit alcohol dehydrogenase family)